MGKVERIWLKTAKYGAMRAQDRVAALEGAGLLGNHNQGGKRQVTLIETRRWAALETTLGRTMDPIIRRANVLVSGVDLAESIGRVLRVGDVRLMVRGETHPCHRMDEAVPGLKEAMVPDWGGGVYAEVLGDGEFAIGDSVVWED